MKQIIQIHVVSKNGKETKFPFLHYDGVGCTGKGSKVQIIIPEMEVRRAVFDAIYSSINNVTFSPLAKRQRDMLFNKYNLVGTDVIVDTIHPSQDIFQSRRFQARKISGLNNKNAIKNEIENLTGEPRQFVGNLLEFSTSLIWSPEAISTYNNKQFVAHDPCLCPALVFLEFEPNKNPEIFESLYNYGGQIHWIQERAFDVDNFIEEEDRVVENGCGCECDCEDDDEKPF
jgi:hypothetical protein